MLKMPNWLNNRLSEGAYGTPSFRTAPKEKDSAFYFAGIFSSIDVLLNSPMEQFLKGLPLAVNVKNALLGSDNEQRRLLNFVMCGKSSLGRARTTIR